MVSRFILWSRYSAYGAAILIFSVYATYMSNSYADSLCQPLKRLLVHADTDFRQLRGYFDPRLQAWVATYRMPGAHVCTIEDVDDIALYSCKWRHDPQAGSVSEAYANMLGSVTNCLNVSDSSQHDHGSDRQSTRLEVSGTRKTIIVERNESGRGGYHTSLNILPLGLKDFPAE
jgi:hypothetical protein